MDGHDVPTISARSCVDRIGIFELERSSAKVVIDFADRYPEAAFKDGSTVTNPIRGECWF
jgi:hypothetical protein